MTEHRTSPDNPAYAGPYHPIPDEEMIVIKDRREIPSHFADEDEEAAFWDTHTLAPHLWRKARGPRPGSLAEKLSRERFTPHAIHSPSADATYVYLAWGQTAKTKTLDARRLVNYDAGGEPIGVQFIHQSLGIDLDGVPKRDLVEKLVADLDLGPSTGPRRTRSKHAG